MPVLPLLLFAAIFLALSTPSAAHPQNDAGWDEDNPEAFLEFSIESRGTAEWRRSNGDPVSVRIDRRLSGELALRGAYSHADLVAQTQSPSAAVAAATPGAAEMELARQAQACGSDAACLQRLAMRVMELQQQKVQAMGNPLRYLIWSPSSAGDNGCVRRWSESIDDQKIETVMLDVPGRGPVRTQRTTTVRAARQRPSHPGPVCAAPPLATATDGSGWTVGFAYLAAVMAEAEITTRDVTTRTERAVVGLVAPVHPEEVVIRGKDDPRGSVTLQGMIEEEGRQIAVQVTITWAAKNIAEVEADPGGPYRVTRGERVELDGSRSRGAGLRYEWTFAPASCPPGLELNRQARLSGVRAQATLLCTTQATLTVTDGHKTDSKSLTVNVVPREGEQWETSFTHLPEDGLLHGSAPFVRRTSAAGDRDLSYVVNFVGGENVSPTDPSRDANETLEPFRQKGTWDNLGYTLEQVSDGGPFDGVWYVQQYRLQVRRQTLINRFLVPNGTPMRIGSFYEETVRRGTDIDAWLEAIRAHEGMRDRNGVLGHSGLIEKALREKDPAREVEPLLSRDRAALVRETDRVLREADSYLCQQSKDPLPLIWTGSVALPFDDSSGWEIVTVNTGGRDYGTPGCK
ncbi:MAG TPA: hypothetical protein VNA04_13395 [Thermoanaerobaculia bacterium]|nr:hypothetical protein [Thermoanaerobaculia bacterium]